MYIVVYSTLYYYFI